VILTTRNAPCHCGSGKRFKHCHGKLGLESNNPADSLRQQQKEAALYERRRQQGFGKPIQSYPVQGGRAVVIGRSIMIGKWSTFSDFVLDYFAERMGRQWIADEMKLEDGGHPIGQWATKMRMEDARPPGIVAKTKINNAFRSLLSAAYNLYLIEHHYEQYDQPLLERMLTRLRIKDGFLATLSETNTAASFLKAGFFLEYENDLQPGQHAEFTATYPQTGQRFSVEVKARDAGSGDGDLKSRLKLKNKLSRALKKDLPWARVVFIDLNIPEVITEIESPLLEELMTAIEEAERTLKIKGKPAPSAYLFLVNQPFHYNLSSTDGSPFIGALGFKLHTFQPRIATFREVILGREMHPEMHALIESMKIHSEPPSTFDGEHPEFLFAEPAAPSRWIVGNEYLVPGPNDEEMWAQLQSGSAHPDTKTMHGVFLANGLNFVVTSPMTESEIAAYKRSPETFFGVIQNVGRHAKNTYELAEFFYETYKNSSKETLLEFLKDHPAIETLRGLSQKDLSIFVCEQWALGADKK
jgi:hypothetical protein